MTSSFRKYYVFYTWNNYAGVLWNGHTVSIQFIQNRKSQHVTLNSAVARVGVTLWNSSLIRPCKIIVSWCMTGKHSGSGLMMPHDAFRDISRDHTKDCFPNWWGSAWEVYGAIYIGNGSPCCRYRLFIYKLCIFIFERKPDATYMYLKISEKREWRNIRTNH